MIILPGRKQSIKSFKFGSTSTAQYVFPHELFNLCVDFVGSKEVKEEIELVFLVCRDSSGAKELASCHICS